MDADEAKALFQKIRSKRSYPCPIPMNKQGGAKRTEACLTGIVTMLIETHSDGIGSDYDPRALTTVTQNRQPLRTLARRVDGAFPSTVNPVAVWEIKEYYHTTTFGSRVADGIDETLLDGMELEELRLETSRDIKYYLMVDSKQTWWNQGKSYLCRMVDRLHMGYVDEVLFGKEVVERLPLLVQEWVDLVRSRETSADQSHFPPISSP